jgi:hypothetical protein
MTLQDFYIILHVRIISVKFFVFTINNYMDLLRFKDQESIPFQFSYIKQAW